MGKSVRMPKDDSSRSIAKKDATVKAVKPRDKVALNSNLLEKLIETREAAYRSVSNVAEMAGVPASAVRQLENGKGPVTTLVAVMEALPFQVAGLAPGRTFAEQLRNCRIKRDMSVDALAAKASLSPAQIVELESGGGSVKSALRVLAVIAPRVRARAQERAHWGLGQKADRDSRFTPPSFMNPIYAAFGKVNLDPCAHPMSPVRADRRFILTNGDNGLTLPWSGRLAFVNPPFSEQLNWLRTAHDHWASGAVETIICLVPARTDSAYFQDTVKAKADIFFLRGRVPFLDASGKSQATPFSLMVVAFGATDQQKASFAALVPGFWVPAGVNFDIAFRAQSAAAALDYPNRHTRRSSTDRSWDLGLWNCKPRDTGLVLCRRA